MMYYNSFSGFYSGVRSSVFRERRSDVRVIEPPAPADEPLKVMDVREHLRIDPISGPSREDPWIEAMIPAVREWCENWLERSIAPQTLEFTAIGFIPSSMELPYGPVISVVSASAAGSALVDFQLGVTPWPTLAAGESMTVVYKAGYGQTGSPGGTPPLPAAILAAMKLMMGHFYENRESTSTLKLEQLPMGVVSLLEPYRRRTSFA